MSPEKSYNGISSADLKQYLEEKYLQFNNPSFIDCDPISIPHRFKNRQDREISGFLAATIAWGRRDLILRSSNLILQKMDNAPYDFIMSSDENDLKRFSGFVHRTFNGTDCISFLRGLKLIYSSYESMEDVIVEGMRTGKSLREGMSYLRKFFFSVPHEPRSEKHFADLLSGAAGKRLFMYLRWMVRKDNRGVDFGIWNRISPSGLFIPLDLHSGNTARKLGMLTRKANDRKSVEEITAILREFDPADPVKYDFALFGLGVSEGF